MELTRGEVGERSRGTVATVAGVLKRRVPQRFVVHISTSWGKVPELVGEPILGVHNQHTRKWRNPKQIRHLRTLQRALYLHPSSAGKGLGPTRSTPSDVPRR